MNEWISILITTIIAPATAAVVAYMVARPKQRADIASTTAHTNGEQASAADRYRIMLNDEIERRKIIGEECEEAQLALRQAVDENGDLQQTINLLQAQLRSAGIIPFTEIQRQQTKPKGGND